MKRTILILTALVAVNVASAQFFVKAGLGYGVSAVTQASSITVLDTATMSNFETASRHSYGNGLNALAAVGYDFTENLGFQIGVGYNLNSQSNEISLAGNATSGEAIVRNFSSKSTGFFTLMPAFTMASNGDKVNLYTRVGVTIPVGGKIITDIDNDYSVSPIDESYTFESKGKFSLGYNAALGFGLPMGDKLSLWAEVAGNFLNVAADTRTMTKYEVNGTSFLDVVPVSGIETIYVDKIDASTSRATTSPTSAIAQDTPFSNVGIQVGIKYSLGNSREDRRNAE